MLFERNQKVKAAKYWRFGLVVAGICVCFLAALRFIPSFFCVVQHLTHLDKQVPNDDGYRTRVVDTQLVWVTSGVKAYYLLNGSFPSTNGNLRNNLELGRVVYGDKGKFQISTCDPWGVDLRYSVCGPTATVTSAGADRVFRSPDDISYCIITNAHGAIMQCCGYDANSGMAEAAIMNWSMKARNKTKR